MLQLVDVLFAGVTLPAAAEETHGGTLGDQQVTVGIYVNQINSINLRDNLLAVS